MSVDSMWRVHGIFQRRISAAATKAATPVVLVVIGAVIRPFRDDWEEKRLHIGRKSKKKKKRTCSSCSLNAACAIHWPIESKAMNELTEVSKQRIYVHLSIRHHRWYDRHEQLHRENEISQCCPPHLNFPTPDCVPTGCLFSISLFPLWTIERRTESCVQAGGQTDRHDVHAYVKHNYIFHFKVKTRLPSSSSSSSNKPTILKGREKLAIMKFERRLAGRCWKVSRYARQDHMLRLKQLRARRTAVPTVSK